MKIGVLAASTLVGAASLVSASFADDGARGMLESSRTQTEMNSAAAARFTAPTQSPQLEGDRPAAGMLPPQRSGPTRDYTIMPSSAPPQGGDIQQTLRN
jgi:hypothetical protein